MVRHHAPTSGPAASAEAGFTLVEVLVAVVILGLTFGAVLGGMATSINTSDRHRQQAETQAVLTSASEHVKSPQTPRLACGENTNAQIVAAYQTAARSVTPNDGAPNRPWPTSSIVVESVAYSDGNGGFGATCYDATVYEVSVVGGTPGQKRRLLTLQQVRIRVTHPDGRYARTLTFLKGVG